MVIFALAAALKAGLVVLDLVGDSVEHPEGAILTVVTLIAGGSQLEHLVPVEGVLLVNADGQAIEIRRGLGT